MAEIELYTTMFCPYCARARALLERKGVGYTEIDIIEEPARRDEMIQRAGGRTSVPQIFINGEHIGGSDELVALDRAGELDAKLGSTKLTVRSRFPAFSSPLRAITSPTSVSSRISCGGRATVAPISS